MPCENRTHSGRVAIEQQTRSYHVHCTKNSSKALRFFFVIRQSVNRTVLNVEVSKGINSKQLNNSLEKTPQKLHVLSTRTDSKHCYKHACCITCPFHNAKPSPRTYKEVKAKNAVPAHLIAHLERALVFCVLFKSKHSANVV